MFTTLQWTKTTLIISGVGAFSLLLSFYLSGNSK